MPKTILCESDIDEVAGRGVKEITVSDEVYLTHAARERAEKMGITMRHSDNAVSVPIASQSGAIMFSVNHSRHQGTTLVQEFRLIRLVRDLTIQRAFYEEIFDWPVIDDWGGGVMYDTGAATFELIQDSEADKPSSSSRIAISVPDVWSLFERLKNKVPVIFPLRDNSWGDTSFRIKDPDGFPITLFTPTM
ncbi:MAG TPA: VOC family protein [Pyrinomonadaceae bacterium]|nr:VOC family protein [Pyrinomonadaceae bacterium]